MNRELLKQMIRETLEEMDISEMSPRPAGTGGAYKITDSGKEILRQVKQTGTVPPGLNASKVAVLIWLFKSEQEGKRVQKMDYAREKGVLQPAVNPLFNDLEAKGFISKEIYAPLGPQKAPGTAKPKPDVSSMLGDLDI